MAVIRVNKTADYTIMSNRHFKEKEMSLKAKGLLSMMLSLPDCWDYSISGLVAICKENESAIKSTLNELKRFGYLVVTKRMPNETESGRIEYEYNIYEQPQDKQQEEKQEVENLCVENQGVENQGQLNTNLSNTNNKNTDNKKINIDYELFKDTYNRFCSSLPKIKMLSDKRKKAIKSFLKQLDFIDFETACKKANESNFLTGNNGNGWKADFDFIIRVDKALNIIEGKYDNQSSKPSEAPARYGGTYL